MSRILAGELGWDVTADISNLKENDEKARGIMAALGDHALKIGAVVGGIFAVKWGFDLFKGFIGDAAEAELAAKRVEQTIKATGGSAGYTADQIQELAGYIQSVSIYEDDAAAGALNMLLQFKNVRGDVFQDAALAAADLASATGQDLSAAMNTVGRALNDPLRGIQMLAREGIRLKDSVREQIAAMVESGDVMGAQKVLLKELEGVYGGAAAAVRDTASGEWQALSNQLGNIGESIGTSLLPGLRQIGSTIEDNLPMIEGFASVIGDSLGTAFNWIAGTAVPFIIDAFWGLVEGISVAVAVAETAWETMPQAFELVGLKLFKGAVDIKDYFAWLFGEVIPAYGAWFLDNWPNVFLDAGNAVITILENFGKNVRMFFTELWDYIKSGGTDEMELSFTPLLDGFQKTMADLPEVAEAQKSDLAKALGGMVDQAAADLGGKYEDAINNAIAGVEAMKPKPGDGKQGLQPPSHGAGDKLTTDDVKSEDDKQKKEKEKKESKASKDSEDKGVQLSGVLETISRIQEAALKPLTDGQQAELAKATAESTKQAAAALGPIGGVVASILGAVQNLNMEAKAS